MKKALIGVALAAVILATNKLLPKLSYTKNNRILLRSYNLTQELAKQNGK